MSWKSSQGLNIDPRLLLHAGLLVLYQARLHSDGTSARPSGATILLSQINLLGLCRHLIWIRHTSVSVTPSALRQKKCIARGRRNNHISCWDAQCENLYQTFLQFSEGHDSSSAATALLARLDRKQRDRWSEAVQNIDFSHSIPVAWSTLYNLTSRSRQSPRQCRVSANAIAGQLVKA